MLLTLFVFAKEQTVVIKIEGMTCPLCTSAIKKSLKKTKGVIKAKVILNSKKATVKYDNNLTNIENLLKAIKNVGYSGKIIKGVDR
jgi:mercuric ion binding protein